MSNSTNLPDTVDQLNNLNDFKNFILKILAFLSDGDPEMTTHFAETFSYIKRFDVRRQMSVEAILNAEVLNAWGDDGFFDSIGVSDRVSSYDEETELFIVTDTNGVKLFSFSRSDLLGDQDFTTKIMDEVEKRFRDLGLGKSIVEGDFASSDDNAGDGPVARVAQLLDKSEK